jgi:hypothetical protein
MLQILDSAEDVIAVRVSHKITSADIDTVMDRLEDRMNRFEKVHVFVETQVIDGLELSGLPGFMAKAMPLLTKLNRFGRVAVVADQAWVRLGTRFESMMLPFISYRVFEPDERDEAFAWVEGREAPFS